jgi:hypothetical protein
VKPFAETFSKDHDAVDDDVVVDWWWWRWRWRLLMRLVLVRWRILDSPMMMIGIASAIHPWVFDWKKKRVVAAVALVVVAAPLVWPSTEVADIPILQTKNDDEKREVMGMVMRENENV